MSSPVKEARRYETPQISDHSGGERGGKTLITCGILQLLKNRGYQVTSFKCGPDYIDPMFHSKVIGMKSRNLDPFFADRGTLRGLDGEKCTGKRYRSGGRRDGIL